MQYLEPALLLVIITLLVAVLRRQSAGSIPANKGRGQVVVDSCGLIDGRITDIVGSGFMNYTVLIPDVVLGELQMLADTKDPHTRSRGRFGLSVARELQDTYPGTVRVVRADQEAEKPVDDRLLDLAERNQASLYTTDYNLAQVARLRGVGVLSVHELADVLRPRLIPGTETELTIIQKGSSRGQGVGYLEDGTMVVVDGAGKYLRQTMTVEIGRMHQSPAGKMAFAKLKSTK